MSKNTFSIIAFSAGMIFVGTHSYLEIERNGGVGIDGKNRRAALATAEAAQNEQPTITLVSPAPQTSTDADIAPDETIAPETLASPPAVTVDEDDMLIDMTASPPEEPTDSTDDTALDQGLSLDEAKDALNEIPPLTSSAPADSEQDVSATALPSGTWTKSSADITGRWAFKPQGQALYLTMDEDFSITTEGALLVLLSAKPFAELTNENAVDGALALGVIVKQSGSQSFPVPDALDLNTFKALAIYDDEANILIGGADL